MAPVVSTLVTLLVCLAILASPFLLAATLNWFQFGRFVIDHPGTPRRPPGGVAGAELSARLALLRAAFALALLAPCAAGAALLAGVPQVAALGVALPLAASVVPVTWAERAYGADGTHRAMWTALVIGAAGGLVALVNGMALARGGGPDAWLEFLRGRLDQPGQSAVLVLVMAFPALLLWGLPCGVVTDVRVRADARLWVAAVLAFLAAGPAVVGIGVLELAYRLAARADRRLSRTEG